MNTTGKTGSEAGGTVRLPMVVFIVAACSTEKVESWAKQQLSIIVEMKIGTSLRTVFTSSTSDRVHRRKKAWFRFSWVSVLILLPKAAQIATCNILIIN